MESISPSLPSPASLDPIPALQRRRPPTPLPARTSSCAVTILQRTRGAIAWGASTMIQGVIRCCELLTSPEEENALPCNAVFRRDIELLRPWIIEIDRLARRYNAVRDGEAIGIEQELMGAIAQLEAECNKPSLEGIRQGLAWGAVRREDITFYCDIWIRALNARPKSAPQFWAIFRHLLLRGTLVPPGFRL